MQAKLIYRAGLGNIITVDKDAFKKKVQEYVDMSPVVKEWNDVKYLAWPNALFPPNTFDTVKELSEVFQVSCAAVEIAKQKVLDEFDPDRSKGIKFDRDIALGTAAIIAGSLIKFKSPSWFPGFASVANKLWLPLLNIIIQFYFMGQTINWATAAMQILGILL